MTTMPCCPIPVRSNSQTGCLNYLETMYHLIQIISQRLNPDIATSVDYQQVIDNCKAVEELRTRVAPNIRFKDQCKTAVDRLQHYAIRLHTSFVISVCCRPALRRDCLRLEPAQKKILAERCRINLAETVGMFLAMHQLSVIPTRTWAFTYHGLSSALLLGILGETNTDPEVRQLQGDLIQALSAAAAKDEKSPRSGVPQSDKDIELSGPLWRALTALKNIYDHGSIGGVRKDAEFAASRSQSVSRSRTPMPHLPPGGQAVAQGGQYPPMKNDPHQDAALAMAEMQNGASLADFGS